MSVSPLKYLNNYLMGCYELCSDIHDPQRIKPTDFGDQWNISIDRLAPNFVELFQRMNFNFGDPIWFLV